MKLITKIPSCIEVLHIVVLRNVGGQIKSLSAPSLIA
jgi:hypothetical protein